MNQVVKKTSFLKIISAIGQLSVILTLLFAQTGCNGHRPGFTRYGSLKAGMSQVQFENDTLKAKIAKLEKQNRTLLADLQKEEAQNGTLAARLDESRNLLKNNGVNLPLDEDNPRMLARAGEGNPPRTTFGQLRSPGVRRSRYADSDPETPDSNSENLSDDTIPENNKPVRSKPKGLQPPGFPDDPPGMENFDSETEIPEVSVNDLSTGWRRLSYREADNSNPTSNRR